MHCECSCLPSGYINPPRQLNCTYQLLFLRNLPLRGRTELKDDGDNDGRQLIGIGSPVPRAQQLPVHAFVGTSLAAGNLEVQPSTRAAYIDASSRCNNIAMFQQADLPGIGTVSASSYGRAITRVSYWVQADVLSGQRGRQQYVRHIAAVHSMVRVSGTQEGPQQGSAPLPALRVARCTVYTPQPALCKGEVLVVRLDQIKYAVEPFPCLVSPVCSSVRH